MKEIIATPIFFSEGKGEKNKIYLGEWCIPYQVNSSNKGTKNILEYNWKTSSDFENQYDYIFDLKNKILPLLSSELNNIHKTKISIKGWNLIIGWWLNCFLSTTLDRYLTLKQLKNNEDYVFYIADLPKEEIVPNDTTESFLQFQDSDLWNHIFFGELIKNFENIKIKKFPYKKLNEKKILKKNSNFIHKFKNIFKLLLKKFLKKFLEINFTNSANIYFFINPNMPLIRILRIKFRLKRSIYLNPKFPDIPNNKFNKNLRMWKIEKYSTDDAFIILVKKLIPFWIPKIFVEGFSDINNDLKKLNFPKVPATIFSSNIHFCGNDQIKIWVALKRDQKSKFIIGQHGGGLNKFNSGSFFEKELSDVYLVHGYGNNKELKTRNIGMFFFRFKVNKWNPRGPALMVNGAMSRYLSDFRSMSSSTQMLDYFNFQFLFYSLLEKKIQNNIKIRIYGKGDRNWKQSQRWSEKYPKAKIDHCKNTLEKEVLNSRIIITTYNATAFLEPLAANIPTIIFWDNKNYSYPKDSKYDFKELEKAKIFYSSPNDAAKFLNFIWDDIEEWWSGEKLQKIRKEFCLKYANFDNKIASRISNVLKE